MRNSDVFCDVSLNKLLNKICSCRCFETKFVKQRKECLFSHSIPWKILTTMSSRLTPWPITTWHCIQPSHYTLYISLSRARHEMYFDHVEHVITGLHYTNFTKRVNLIRLSEYRKSVLSVRTRSNLIEHIQRTEENGYNFADATFRRTFMSEMSSVLIKISTKFVLIGVIYNTSISI